MPVELSIDRQSLKYDWWLKVGLGELTDADIDPAVTALVGLASTDVPRRLYANGAQTLLAEMIATIGRMVEGAADLGLDNWAAGPLAPAERDWTRGLMTDLATWLYTQVRPPMALDSETDMAGW